ncbi:zinc finger protein ZAT5-like [Lolium rigidum]|uniref:zinc finger protein ZAT5-like n=1 Tax=Lolium rigidum TaxID=89674 RepID=UPI001F5C8FA2|nr:zinc finger protein ZAT5-like [Lolium rigidum]
MGAGMKRVWEEQPVSLSLALSTDSTSSTTSSDSSGAAPMAARKRARRGKVVATSGQGDFVCKTCGRAFATFQALGGHRTSHLRGRHGLELGVGVAKAIREKKRSEDKQQHECHICGLGFEMGQALGGHMRRHRDEMALTAGADNQWIILQPHQEEVVGHGAHRPTVLLELSVALGFMDGVGEAAAATPSDGFFLLLCPRCCGVVSGAKVEQTGFVQEYVQTVVCTGDD